MIRLTIADILSLDRSTLRVGYCHGMIRNVHRSIKLDGMIAVMIKNSILRIEQLREISAVYFNGNAICR